MASALPDLQLAQMQQQLLATASSSGQQLPPGSDTTLLPPSTTSAYPSHRVRSLATTSRRHSCRLTGLSAVYLERLCELVTSGSIMPQQVIAARIHITKVQIAGNMRRVYVYWSLSSDNSSSSGGVSAAARVCRLQQLLDASSCSVREALSQCRISSIQPAVQFVYDHRAGQLAETMRRLAVADYGPDHKPLAARQPISAQLQSNDSQPAAKFLASQTDASGAGGENDDSDASGRDVTSGLQQQNSSAGDGKAAGLNRPAIMAQILLNMQRSSALHRQNGVETFPEVVEPNQSRAALFRQISEKKTRDLKRQLAVIRRRVDDEMFEVCAGVDRYSDDDVDRDQEDVGEIDR